MTRTDTLVSEISTTLRDNILSFWQERMADPKGGFYGEMDCSGKILEDSSRGLILNARLVWSFSAAYKATGESGYLLSATHAKDYFLKHFLDHKWGGVYWSVDKDGKRLDDKKQLYAQAFAIYGLSEYYGATGDDEALKFALNTYKIVEKHFSDKENGGYIEALSRDFSPLEDMSLSEHDINADKTMNSHLHLLEAYANLYKVHPDPWLGERTKELLDVLLERILDRESGHLNLYFTSDWKVLPGAVSYGHDIETSWLALEAAFALRDIDIINKVRPLAAKMAKAGMEGALPDGSLIYETSPEGKIDSSRQWWVQAEGLVGNLWLWKYHGKIEAIENVFSTWEYIKSHLIDYEGGEWWWSCEQDGSHPVDKPKAGFWKCPYHNSRMCLQVLENI